MPFAQRFVQNAEVCVCVCVCVQEPRCGPPPLVADRVSCRCCPPPLQPSSLEDPVIKQYQDMGFTRAQAALGVAYCATSRVGQDEVGPASPLPRPPPHCLQVLTCCNAVCPRQSSLPTTCQSCAAWATARPWLQGPW